MKDLKKCHARKEGGKLQKSIKGRRMKLKSNYYKQLADNIKTAAEARDVEKEFPMAKKYTTFKTSNKLSIYNEKLKTHFKSHFAARDLPLPPELEKSEKFPFLQDVIIKINEDIPNEEEVKNILKSFKNNKSSGTDKLKTKGLKYNESKQLILAILTLLTMIWTLVKVPIMWMLANITCLYKKGLRSVAANYRGLSIGANMSRILAKIITNRLKQAYETHTSNTQCGFRQNRSTADGILIVKSIIEKYGQQIIAVYVDLTKHLIAILQKMYEGRIVSIAGMKSNFDVLIGCRQGGQESPCLFTYYLVMF